MRLLATASLLLLFPALCLAQGSSNDPNILFLEAQQRFELAAAAHGTERADMLRDVAAILQRISSDFPQSSAAQMVRDGIGPEGMNLGAIFEAIGAASIPEDLPEVTRRAISALTKTACHHAVPACQGDVAADLVLIVDYLFADTTRAVDVQANRLLFSDPGRFDSVADRATLFADVIPYLYMTNQYSSEPDLLPTRLKESRSTHCDDQMVTDYGLSLATALLAELLARHYEATGHAKAAGQTRDWIVPLVDISLVRADSDTVTEPFVEVSWMSSFVTFVELAAKLQASDQAGPLLDLQLKKLAAEMHSIHQTLRTGVLIGYIFNEAKNLDDPMVFGATENRPLWPELEEAMRAATRAQAALQKGWLQENRLGSIQEINTVLEPVRQLAAAGAPAASVALEQPSAAPTQVTAEDPWGPEVVAGEGYYERVFACNEAGSSAARHDCALQQGVPAAAVAFSRAVEAPEGVILATGFMELGAVDVVYNSLHAAWFQYLVNGEPDIITIELTDAKAWYTDAMAQLAFSGDGDTRVYNSEVTGYRLMPDGSNRLIVVDRIVGACENCPMGGLGLRHIDFDASGKLLGARAAGILPWEGLYSEDEDAQVLHAEPRWLQYRLARFGFEPGMFDGELKPETHAALADFAREHCVVSQLASELIFDTLADSDPLMPAPCAGVPANAKPATGGTLIGWYEGGPDTGMRCTVDWAPLQLYTNRIMYHETGCDLDIPVAPDFTEHSTTATCHGEGESWKETIQLLRRGPDLLSIVKNGYSFDYTRCVQTPTGPHTAPAATADTLIGRYGFGSGTELSCDQGGLPVTLFTDRVTIHESSCELDIPVTFDFTEHSTTATCHGEGESWKEDITLLRPSPDVLTIVKGGHTFDYFRCPE